MNSSINNLYLDQSNASTFSSKLRHLWKTLLDSWAANALNINSEPRIREEKRAGEMVWSVYDPTTQRSLYLSSETEVRCWLEKRYYSQNTAHSTYQAVGYMRR